MNIIDETTLQSEIIQLANISGKMRAELEDLEAKIATLRDEVKRMDFIRVHKEDQLARLNPDMARELHRRWKRGEW